MGDYVLLSVSDTGEGITAEDIDKIFEPFYTRKKAGKTGVGLGMAVVWGTIKDHRGHIQVVSAKGRGTTINLYFPVITGEEDIDSPQPGNEDYSGKGETILVVDDQESQREIAGLILSDLGYKVETASSGEEAIEYLESHQVDLVVLDMVMIPGIDGCETYKRIVKFKPSQKAIIVSGYSEDERVKMAQELGAGPFIGKPYLIKEIGSAIRAVLDR